MTNIQRRTFIFVSFFIAITFIGFFQSWNVALGIFNLCIISAIMALGVNIQLGYAGTVSYTHLTLPTTPYV